MDYEKAYKAALETATKWIKDGCIDKEKVCLECVFPELRESEDERNERIRKAILGLSYLDGIEPILTKCSVTRSDIRSYLKKQKESLHIPETCKENADSFTDEDERIRKGMIRFLESEQAEGIFTHEARLSWISYLEKQKEIPLMNGDADLYFDEWNQQKPNPTKRQCFEEGMKYAQRLQKEQTLTEWSEFDKCALEDAICATDLLGNDESFNKSNPNLAKAFRVAKDWLKSLPERFSLQPKVEWSEEDEDKLEECIRIVSGWERDYDIVKSPYSNFLKSLRPSKEPSKDEERLINTSISFLKDFADKGYENAVECIDWLKSKLNGNTCK